MLRVKARHRLMCGDATSSDDVARLMGDEIAKLCFTSPPYADQREYGGGKELSSEHLATFIVVASESVELFAVNLGMSRKDGAVNPYWDDYIAAAKACGLKLLSWNVWDRLQPNTISQQTAMFAIEHEWILVFGTKYVDLNLSVPNKCGGQRRGGDTSNPEGVNWGNEFIHSHRRLGTICRIDIHHSESLHPAMFPVALPESYIEACTAPGDAVYEPFCGSGTTLIACEKLARRCLAMEISPEYVDLAVERWERFTGRQAVLAC